MDKLNFHDTMVPAMYKLIFHNAGLQTDFVIGANEELNFIDVFLVNATDELSFIDAGQPLLQGVGS